MPEYCVAAALLFVFKQDALLLQNGHTYIDTYDDAFFFHPL